MKTATIGFIREDADINAVAEAVEFYWGERCPDFEEGCPTCAAWGQYDKMQNLTPEEN
jgi:hypothetical protein